MYKMGEALYGGRPHPFIPSPIREGKLNPFIFSPSLIGEGVGG